MKEANKTEGIDMQVVKEWVEQIRNGNRFYEDQIGEALEWKDEIAIDFLQKAVGVDKRLVETYFGNFLSLALKGNK